MESTRVILDWNHYANGWELAIHTAQRAPQFEYRTGKPQPGLVSLLERARKQLLAECPSNTGWRYGDWSEVARAAELLSSVPGALHSVPGALHSELRARTAQVEHLERLAAEKDKQLRDTAARVANPPSVLNLDTEAPAGPESLSLRALSNTVMRLDDALAREAKGRQKADKECRRLQEQNTTLQALLKEERRRGEKTRQQLREFMDRQNAAGSEWQKQVDDAYKRGMDDASVKRTVAMTRDAVREAIDVLNEHFDLDLGDL